MNDWSHLKQQIVDALSHVPTDECGRLMAYALAIKYNVATGKDDDHGTAREIAMALFQVPEEDLFQIVAEAYTLSIHQPHDDFHHDDTLHFDANFGHDDFHFGDDAP